jgi:hypothetical protein
MAQQTEHDQVGIKTIQTMSDNSLSTIIEIVGQKHFTVYLDHNPSEPSKDECTP